MYSSLLSRTAIVLLLPYLLILGCSSGGGSGDSVGPEPQFPKAADYFFANDTSQIMVLRFTDSRDTCEPFVNWEEIIGEPYTDVNGNGVYDNGIDGFIRSSDQSINQDLNFNGRHDGPENMSRYQWERPIPFDDLDGNRTMRFDDEYLSPDCAYAPFVDWNGNGVWDSAVNEGTLLGRWEAYGYDPASVQHFVSGIASAYYFL